VGGADLPARWAGRHCAETLEAARAGVHAAATLVQWFPPVRRPACPDGDDVLYGGRQARIHVIYDGPATIGGRRELTPLQETPRVPGSEGIPGTRLYEVT
jgi:hypothetical protein